MAGGDFVDRSLSSFPQLTVSLLSAVQFSNYSPTKIPSQPPCEPLVFTPAATETLPFKPTSHRSAQYAQHHPFLPPPPPGHRPVLLPQRRPQPNCPPSHRAGRNQGDHQRHRQSTRQARPQHRRCPNPAKGTQRHRPGQGRGNRGLPRGQRPVRIGG